MKIFQMTQTHTTALILILSVILIFKSIPEQNPEDLFIGIMGCLGAALIWLWIKYSEYEKANQDVFI